MVAVPVVPWGVVCEGARADADAADADADTVADADAGADADADGNVVGGFGCRFDGSVGWVDGSVVGGKRLLR